MFSQWNLHSVHPLYDDFLCNAEDGAKFSLHFLTIGKKRVFQARLSVSRLMPHVLLTHFNPNRRR